MINFKIFPYKLQSTEVVCHRYTLSNHKLHCLTISYIEAKELGLVSRYLSSGYNYLFLWKFKYPIDLLDFINNNLSSLCCSSVTNFRFESLDYCFSCNRISPTKIVINMYMTPDYAKSF